jgi:hypothetical protein
LTNLTQNPICRLSYSLFYVTPVRDVGNFRNFDDFPTRLFSALSRLNLPALFLLP